MVEKIKKRSGQIVSFDQTKIASAVQKAYLATIGGISEIKLKSLLDKIIIESNQASKDLVIEVEKLQDIVEKAIMSLGDFNVAKAYIIYRYEHTKIREQQTIQERIETDQKITERELNIIKRDGTKEKFDLQKYRNSIIKASEGFKVDTDKIINLAKNDLFDGITTENILRASVLATRSFIDLDVDYSKLAARLTLHRIYKTVLGSVINFAALEDDYRSVFKRNIELGITDGRLSKQLLDFDLDKIAEHLVLDRDNLFEYLGIQTIYDRYLLRFGKNSEIQETPQAFWMRVAMGIAIREDKKEDRAIEFYNTISNLDYVPSTPTLLHAGLSSAQLSSCFINTVNDDLSHIFKVYGDNAQILKWSGGVATDWTNVRATGSRVKKINIESQGVIPYLKINNDTTVAINRSGKRRGAAAVYLETWHYDIESFLELRKNTGDERRRTHDINTVNWIPDLFMERMLADQNWTLFSPDEVPDLHSKYGKDFKLAYENYEKQASLGKIKLHKTIPAKDLWKKMLSLLYETGHPWINFKDACNLRSPQDHVGVIHSSNLCTEITLNTSNQETAVCNLGSLNLARHITNIDGRPEIDFQKLARTTQIAIRMLDNVIDINFYPTAEGKKSNLNHRPIGLGIMGFADLLYQLGVYFDSEDAIDTADLVHEHISYHAILTSSELAASRGSYATFSGSKWDRGILPLDTLDTLARHRGREIQVDRRSTLNWDKVRDNIRKYGMRNSNCLAIAPTATISNIAGTIPSIEPIYKNVYVKSNMGGDFIVINKYLIQDLKKINLWNEEMATLIKVNDGEINNLHEIPEDIRRRYQTVFQIHPSWLIKSAARRGKWIDQSQSLNIFYSGTSGAEISQLYIMAWEMGLKTTYYLRTLAASQVEKSTIATDKFGTTHLRNSGKTSQSDNYLSLPKEAEISTGNNQEQATVTSETYIKIEENSTPTSTGISYEKLEEAKRRFLNQEIKLCRIEDPDCESCQ